jgi:type I restriction enzyme S subunit
MSIRSKVSSGWINYKLGSLCTKITDGTHKTPEYKDAGIVFISAKNVRDGILDFKNHSFISYEEHRLLTKRCKPEAGDVMLSKSGSLGDSVVIPKLEFEFSIFESLALMKVKKEIVSPKYLMQIFNSPLAKRYFLSITTGLAVKHLHLGDLKKMPILLPSLQEQEAIIGLLSAWDEAIEKTEQLIAKKQKFYKAQLSKRLSINGLGCIKLKKYLNEVSKRNRDLSITQVLSVTNSKGFVRPEDQFSRQVASDNLSNYKIVSKGEYAYNPSRINVGSIARLDDWDLGVLSPMYTVFEINKSSELHTDLFLHWLNSREARMRIKLSSQGSVRETVSFDDFCAIGFPKIDFKEQEALAEYFNLLLSEVDSFKAILEKYKTQKRGLMQKMLTGEWRIKPEIIKYFEESL